MVLIAGLLVGLALFYFWLSGHWFARVLAFLVAWPTWLVIITGLVFGFGQQPSGPTDPHNLYWLIPMSGVAAWCAASLPTFYWRRRRLAAIGGLRIVL